MDDTTKVIIDRIAIRFPRPTRIPSGHICSVFYDTYQLTPSELARLAADATGHLDHDLFDMVVGLAYSGILYASAVAGGRMISILQKDGKFFGPDLRGRRVMVVDDVVFTGRHLQEAAGKVEAEGGVVVGCACIIDRSGNRPDNLSYELWSAFQTEMA
jgi:orotate phosphoribosyltransferase